MKEIFDDLIKQVDQAIKNVKDFQAIADRLLQKRLEFEQMLKLAEQVVKEINPPREALESIKGIAPRILLREGLNACATTHEFNIPPFRERLKRALSHPKALTLRTEGQVLVITNNLNQVAGTLRQYGNAISLARKAQFQKANITRNKKGKPSVRPGVKRKHGIEDPVIASRMWAEKFYGAGRENKAIPPLNANRKDRTAIYKRQYAQTIATRIKSFGSLAPFWEIIDKGTVNINLSSDRGGTPYPAYDKTEFVQKTKNEIQRLFKEQVRLLTQQINDVKNSTTRLKGVIKYIDTQLLNLDDPLRKRIREEFEKRLQERFNVADRTKLINAIEAIAKGELVGGRVSLGTSPEGVRIRPRVIELQRAIAQFRNR